MNVAEKQNKQQSELHSKLWSMANDLRGTMDASEFKNYILGLIFFVNSIINLSSILYTLYHFKLKIKSTFYMYFSIDFII